MFSRFFIERPIFASVISIVIVLIGGATIPFLPVEQTPDITPPTVVVSTKYPGASAEVVAETVAAPIEEEVNGVENMIYMFNKCSDDGSMELTVTFEVGTDIDMAAVLVQNRVAVAMPKLPEEVKREGVTTKKKSTNMVLMVNLVSPDGSFDEIYLSNYITQNIKDRLARVSGVGEAKIFGAKDLGMRIWLEPNLLRARGLTTNDVVAAIREQNVQVAAGQIGAPPSPPGQRFQYTVRTLGRLSDAEQFADMIVKVGKDGRVVTVGDVCAKDTRVDFWLDAQRLQSHGLSAEDVLELLRTRNLRVSTNVDTELKKIKADVEPDELPSSGQQFTVRSLGNIGDVSHFQRLIVKRSDSQQPVTIGDVLAVDDKDRPRIESFQVPRVEEGAQAYNWSVSLDGAPSIGVGVFQLPGANSLAIAEGIRAEMEAVAKNFPVGVKYEIAYDTTMFVKASIEEVIETLFIAVVLVVFTVWIFLQDFRTTLVPALTIPVALIGTFAVMMVLGLSINTLSLFGLVLAIGIVVDDAIVVVENTMRLIDEEGLSAKAATAKAMEQVTGPVIATTLVLLAVFIPTAVMPGITGRLYKQFALTIATATVFSSINALTLSPALCGVLLRPTPTKKNWFFRGFDRLFESTTNGYMSIVRIVVRRSAFMILIFAGLVGAMIFGFIKVPMGFIPEEDQGYFMITARLPDAASLQRTDVVMAKIGQVLDETEGVQSAIGINGYSALDAQAVPNAGSFFVILKPWSDRPGDELHVSGIIKKVQEKVNNIQESLTIVFSPPPITGLGNAGGFELQLKDVGNVGVMQLDEVANDLLVKGTQHPVLTRMNSNLRAGVPQVYLDVDRVRAKKIGVPLETIFSTLQAYLGSAYVNDFNKYGRVYRVMIQADGEFRRRVEDIARLRVRSNTGQMIPLSTLTTVSDTVGPQTVYRFNLFNCTTITGQPAPGRASGEAIAAFEDLQEQLLPASMEIEWSGITRQQIAAGSWTIIIFSFAIILVYLFLAAQYESWGIPAAVMLSVPLALLGGIAITAARGYDNNVYTQIGIVLLIGLASKNAILIVEFAKQRRAEGKSVREAATDAAHLRFRAILMTAFSFILGVIPLVVASGAGSASRRALGTAVFGGMLMATILGVFFIPLLYVVVQSTADWLVGAAEPEKTAKR